jgi:exodeoxyribonuclease VII large subunit
MDAGTLTVGQLASGIDAALSSWFAGELWVVGEIDSLRRSNSGHVYFQLVERSDEHGRAAASIDVALFDAARRYVNTQLVAAGGVRMTDGMQVRIRGRLEYYPPQGRVQLRMSGIDPAYTLALLLTERDRVLASLAADDLLERNRAAVMPDLPLRVGLATSDGSAAMADFVDELRGSGFAWRLTVVHVPVQGRGADHKIARAIDMLAGGGPSDRVDVIALVRGGGSRIDLSTFDSEAIGRAIASSSIPVLTGIGHEIDMSVADVVAHQCFKTPTACAAAVVNRVRATHERTERLWSTINATVPRLIGDADQAARSRSRRIAWFASVRLDSAMRHFDIVSQRTGDAARQHVAIADTRVARLADQLARRPSRALIQAERELAVSEAIAQGADPSKLMRRGWSITRTAAGSVVRDCADVTVGDQLLISVATGVITSEVTATTPDGGEDAAPDDA